MNSYEKLINHIDEIIKSGIGSADFMIGKIEMSIDLFNQNQSITIKQIVCKYLNVDESLLIKKTRKREVVIARQVSMYFYRKYEKLSLKETAKKFNSDTHKFDHATVVWAIKTVNNIKDTDKIFRHKINEIEEQIKQYYLRNNVL